MAIPGLYEGFAQGRGDADGACLYGAVFMMKQKGGADIARIMK